MQKSAYAFTLIELVIAISIMAIIGVITFANYKPFGEDQNLKSAVLDIQSLFRTAQISATTNAKCNTQFGATWQAEFTDTKTTKLKCQEPSPIPLPAPITKKIFTLGTNIEILSVAGASCPSASALPFTINFAPLSSKISIKAGNTEYLNCRQLTITLRNTKTGSTKSVIIEQGGRIYVP